MSEIWYHYLNWLERFITSLLKLSSKHSYQKLIFPSSCIEMAPSSTLHSSSPTDTSSNGNHVTKPVSSLWRLDTIPGKGKGLIATQNITPGTLILSDSPLITTECITSIETTEKDLARALKALPKDHQREFLSLHNNYPGKGSPLSNIVRSNGYPLGPGSEVGGVFPNVSRMNHSCRPNAKHTWNEKLKQQTVYAIHPIAEGEELYLSYLAGGTSEERKETLKEHFGFDCTCELCSLPPAQLQKSDYRIIRSQDLYNKIGDPDLATSNPGKLMALGKRLLGKSGSSQFAGVSVLQRDSYLLF